MKMVKMLGIATGLLMVSSPALATQAEGEVGYSKGSLGYDALMAGDNETAVKQLESTDNISENDPARLINLGQAYARTGRTGDAAKMFMAAMNSDRNFALVLSDGTVIDSREAAKLALNNLNNRLASR